MSILKTIHNPADFKRLTPAQFPKLCQELREQIIAVVSNVGGHLASNLGVVELTVALHYLMDTPRTRSSGIPAIRPMPISCLPAAGAVPHPSPIRRIERILQAGGECLRYVQCRTCGHRRIGCLRDGRGPGAEGSSTKSSAWLVTEP